MQQAARNAGAGRSAAGAATLPEWRCEALAAADFARMADGLDDARIAEAEWMYLRGRFEEAILMADELLPGKTQMARLVALCVKFKSNVCIGDASSAYPLMFEARAECSRIFEHPESQAALDAAVVSAHILDGFTRLHAGDIPQPTRPLDQMPTGVQIYSGFQMAALEFSKGNLLQALGVISAFLSIAGRRYPIPCIKLHLLAACCHLRLRDAECAAKSWRDAWAIADELGVIAPFIELNAYMPGLTRHCLKDTDERSYLVLRSIVRSHRIGWLGVRTAYETGFSAQDGLGCSGTADAATDAAGSVSGFAVATASAAMTGRLDAPLSLLEIYVSLLAAWGWSNREIARYLDVAESTVKHHLTSVYQKFGVSRRSQLADFLARTSAFGIGVVMPYENGKRGERQGR